VAIALNLVFGGNSVISLTLSFFAAVLIFLGSPSNLHNLWFLS
jgi:hypothetical protein